MCGRFVIDPDSEFTELKIQWWKAIEKAYRENVGFNKAPTQVCPVIRNRNSKHEGTGLKWGLIPSWAKDAKIGYRTINARSETIHEKPSFRSAFKKRRCWVVASGYYEWQKIGPREKHTYHIHRPDGRPFLMCGLWESWRGPRETPFETPMETFTICTTDSSPSIAHLHDRMPVVFDGSEDFYEAWLDPEFKDYEFLKRSLRSYDELQATRVSSFVNNVRNQGVECVAPFEE